MERSFEKPPENLEHSPPIKGSLRECWRKDLRAMGLEGLRLDLESVKIALAAQRIVFLAQRDLHIYNFDGTREGRITVGRRASEPPSFAVTSDCSRILVWNPGRWRGDTVAYNPKGDIELETNSSYAFSGAQVVRTSLDGSLFAAKSDNLLDLWDWHGNKLLNTHPPGIMLNAQKFYGFDIAPNAGYIAISQGLYGPTEWFVHRIPSTDDLLKISDLQERYKTAMGETEEFVRLPYRLKDKPENSIRAEPSRWDNAESLSASDNRLAVRAGDRSIVYIDINKKSRLVPSDQDLVEKPEAIEAFKMTSGGRYLYYTTRRGKRTSFNIFDTEKRVSMRELLTFQEDSKTRPYFYPSHDGTKLIVIEVISKRRFSKDIMISMLNVE